MIKLCCMPIQTNLSSQSLSPAEQSASSKSYISFSTTEFLDFERGLSWYLICLLAIGALVYYSLLQYAWTFTALLLVFAGTYFAFLSIPLKFKSFQVHDDFLKFGNKKVLYRDLSDFWVEFLPSNHHVLHCCFQRKSKEDLKILLPNDCDVQDLEITLMQFLPHSSDKQAGFIDNIIYLLRL